ncbi:MAG: hypothetical protein IPO63_14865 [Bacteroidetes bacterium]|nr:hypothetical protein [Bacteroidota bacterium]
MVEVLPTIGVNSIPYTEGFETISFPGGGWAVENPNNNNAWNLSLCCCFRKQGASSY